MKIADLIRLAPLAELLPRKLANRPEHAEARLAIGLALLAHEALVDQRGDGIQGIRCTVAVEHDALDRVERGSPGEDREAGEDAPIGLVQELVAPGDGAPQGLLPFGQVPRATGEQPELIA